MIRVVFDVCKKRNIAIGLHRRKEVRMSLENVRINVGASDPYEGPYVVTPSTYNDIGLQTKSKWISDVKDNVWEPGVYGWSEVTGNI